MLGDWFYGEIQRKLSDIAGTDASVSQGMRPTDQSTPAVVWWVDDITGLGEVGCNNAVLVVRAWLRPEQAEEKSARRASREMIRRIVENLHRWNVNRSSPEQFLFCEVNDSSRIVERDLESFAARGWEANFTIQVME